MERRTIAIGGGLSSGSGSSVASFVTSGLLADYDFTEGSGTVITDRSGNGNTGNFGAGGNAPTWASGASGGLVFNGGQFVTLPATLNGAITIEFFMNWQEIGQTQYASPLAGSAAPGATSNALLLQQWSATYNTICAQPMVDYNSAFQNFAQSTCFNGLGMLTWKIGSPSDAFYINGYKAPNGSGGSGSLGVQTAGTWLLGGGAAGQGVGAVHYGIFTIYRLRFFNRALTDAEVSQDSSAMQLAMVNRGLVPALGSTSVSDTVVFDGDSITQGQATGIPPNSYGTFTGFSTAMFGVGGRTLLDAVTYSPYGTDLMRSTSSRNVVLVWLGTNDLRIQSKTAAQTFAYLGAYCRARRAAGWKVIIGTMISSNFVGGADAMKNSYNALIRQNWRSIADGLADFASNTKIGADGSSGNATYFADGTHPTTLSNQTIIAPIMQTAVMSLYGNYDISTANVYTGNTTQADADVYTVLGSIGAAATFTLLSGQRWMGQTLTIKNTNASGFAWTIAAGSGLGGETELIEGAATLAIANGATVRLQPKLVSATAAGVNWFKVS